MKKFFLKFDSLLLISFFALGGFGILMIYSASVGDSDQTNYVLRQSLYFLFGAIVFLFVVYVGLKLFSKISYWLYAFLVLLLVLTFILGLESRGSVRWIDFGFFTL